MSHVEIAKQSVGGSLKLFVGNFLSALISAVGAIIIARVLGPEGYGIYTLALLIPGIFQLLLGIGVNTALTRYTAYHISRNEPEVAKRITVNAMLFLLMIGGLLALVAYFGADHLSTLVLHRAELGNLVRYASILVFAQMILQSCIAGFMGWNSMGLVSVTSTMQSILKLAIAPVLVLVGFGVLGAIMGYILSVLMAGIFALSTLCIYRLRSVKGERGRFFSDIRQMLAYGLPLYAGGLLLGYSSQYITIILAAVATNTVVGNYQAASNVTTAITVVTSAISFALLPAFASLHGTNADTSLAFRYAVKYVSFLLAPIIFLLAGASGPIVDILYGMAYSSGAVFLKLLAFSEFPLILGLGVIPPFFNGLGRTRLSMYVNATLAISILVLAPLLSTGIGLGVNGLIYSILISNFLSTFLGLGLSEHSLKARMDIRSVTLTLLASLLSYAAVATVETLNLSSIVAVLIDMPLFFIIYLTALPLLHAIDVPDLKRLEIALDGIGSKKLVVRPLLAYEGLLLRLRKQS